MSKGNNINRTIAQLMLFSTAFLLLGGIANAGFGGGGSGSTVNFTVITNVTNNYGGTLAPSNFTIHVKYSGNGTEVSGSPASGSSSGVVFQLQPGNYTVSEDSASGYSATFNGTCTSTGQVSLVNVSGQSCTVTNRDMPAHVTVYENVVGGPLSASAFAIEVGGNNPSPSAFSGSSGGTLVTMGQGNYSVNANEIRFSNSSYYAQSYSSGCVGSILIGQNTTCTVTSTFTVPAALSVTLNSDVAHVEIGGMFTFSANVVGGTGPFTYTILVKNTTSSGQYIPTGQSGSFASDGKVIFTETPPKLGADFYEIIVTDSLGQTASATEHVVVSADDKGVSKP